MVIFAARPAIPVELPSPRHVDIYEEFDVLKGDWKSAKGLIERDRSLLTKTVSVHSRTLLHFVACEGNWEFLEELVKFMSPEGLQLQDALGCTALHYAAVGGSIKACKALAKKNPSLTQSVSNIGWTPLLSAAHCAPKDKEVVYYLYSVTTNDTPGQPFTGRLAGMLAFALATGGFHDLLLHSMETYRNLATYTDESGHNILDVLVSRPQAFESGRVLGTWQNWVYPFVVVDLKDTAAARYGLHFSTSSTTEQVVRWPRKLFWNCIELFASSIKQVRDAKLAHKSALELVRYLLKAFSNLNDSETRASFQLNTITAAASSGIVEIVKECLQMFPDIIWRLSTEQQTLLIVAVQYRQEKILSLMHNMVVYNKFTSPKPIDEFNNSILHLAARLAPPVHLRLVPGVALQMQRELQWFKEVEKLVHPFLKDLPNKAGKTAQVVFTEQHKYLLEKAEKWMKDTSNSCMVVTALIATIMFAAAFTMPGGNNQDTGIPIFLSDKLFMVFAISDALGLIFSSTSLLVFLSIQTARYAEEDFLESLPKRLITGLASLFLAIVNMMIAFSATFSVALRERSKWVAIAVPFLASLPVTIYAILQLPLFVQMYQSTYGSRIFRPVKIY